MTHLIGLIISTMDKLLSQKFRFFTFLSIILVVFIHCYNLQNRYLQPFTIVEEPLTVTTFVEYWVCNGLVRFIIPLLFIISGFLFASGDEQSYKFRILKRLRTLLFPYLIWSAITLILTYWLQQFPASSQVLKDARLDQLGDNRPYSQFAWSDLLLRWTLFPIAFQLWFLRCLFVYNLAYPLLLKALTYYPKIWFSIVSFLWLVSFGAHFMEGEGLLFFSLGIYSQKRPLNIKKTTTLLQPKRWIGVYLVASILKTFLAFYFKWDLTSFIILSIFHKTTVLSGLIVVWFSLDRLIIICMRRPWFVSVCSYSFFIYAIHVPFVCFAICYLYRYYPFLLHHRLLLFCLHPIATILTALLIGKGFKLISPKLYALFTGGRG